MAEELKRMPHEWVIVSFKKPLQWTRGGEEVWMLNPNTRYILNAQHADFLAEHVESRSPLKTSAFYSPLTGKSNLRDARILIERSRDCGVGDMLFMTGPLQFIRDMSGGTARVDFYGLSDRSAILVNHPALPYGPVTGPVIYDALPSFKYHWFIEHVTEHDEERDQANVYDALFQQMGLDPKNVPDRYKRPSLRLVDSDMHDTEGLYMLAHMQKKIDLHLAPYYVVAPLSYSSMRTAPYKLWLEVIETLAANARPVVVVGKAGDDSQVPTADMSFGQFNQAVNKMSESTLPVFNLMGATMLRTLAALIARSQAVLSMDSGLLYVAQALRIPAVSLWGTHSPAVRIKYDPMYMQLAVWKQKACPHSPCNAYAGFPRDKCPRGQAQRVCEVFSAIKVSDVLEMVSKADAIPR